MRVLPCGPSCAIRTLSSAECFLRGTRRMVWMVASAFSFLSVVLRPVSLCKEREAPLGERLLVPQLKRRHRCWAKHNDRELLNDNQPMRDAGGDVVVITRRHDFF